MFRKIAGFIALLLSGAWWLGLGREFVKAYLFDRILHMLNPYIHAITVEWLFNYGPPAVLTGLGLYLLLRHGRKSPEQSPPRAATAGPPPTIETPEKPPDPASLPPRNVSLLNAIWRAHMGCWGQRKKLSLQDDHPNTEAVHFFQVCDEIRQHAFEGTLPVWGRRKGFSLFEPIPRKFWLNRAIQADLVIRQASEETWIYFTHALEVGDVPGAKSKEWEDFMTNKETVERLWPAPPKDFPQV